MEPLRMLAHPWVVGRTLDREIQGYLDPERAGSTHEAAEIRERAEFGVDRAVAALRRADRIGAAGIARLRDGAVVLALAVDAANRMDWNEINDVEPELGDLGEACDAIVKGGTLAGFGSLAPREHFIPCGKSRCPTVDDDFELAGIAHHVAAQWAARHQITHCGRQKQLRAAGGVAVREVLQHFLGPRGITGPSLPQRGFDDRAPLVEFKLDILTGCAFFFDFVAPAFELIGPGFNRVMP